MMRKLMLVTGMLVAGTAASANTAAEIMSRWGLLGVWRINCSLPRSDTNPDRIFTVRNGRALWEQNYGKFATSVPVTSAIVRPDRALELTLALPKGVIQMA